MSLSPHPNHNVTDALLLLNMEALCTRSGSRVTLTADVTFFNVNSVMVSSAQSRLQVLGDTIFPNI